MKNKSIAKSVLLIIGLASFLFYFQGNYALAGMGIIIAGIWVVISGLNGADVLILAGILSFSIAYSNRFLFTVTIALLLCVAAYDSVQLYRISRKTSDNCNKNKQFELFHEKQLITLVLKKIKTKNITKGD